LIEKTRPEMFPLTAHGLDPREFVTRWQGTQAMFAELSPSEPFPGGYGWMDFSGALLALKAGHLVARPGWDKLGRYLALQVGYPDGIGVNANTAEATGVEEGSICVFQPYLMMCLGHRPVHARIAGQVHAGDPTPVFVPWQPGADDLLATDWVIRPRRTDRDEPVDVTEFGAARPTRFTP
jgi:hypothetical protein